MNRSLRSLEPSRIVMHGGGRSGQFIKRDVVPCDDLACEDCPLLSVEYFENHALSQSVPLKMGIGCITYLFADSESGLVLQDEFGHPGYMAAGTMRIAFGRWDTHWTETPVSDTLPGRGLRLFFELPFSNFDHFPQEGLTSSCQRDHLTELGAKICVLAGEHNGVQAAQTMPLPFTMLDVALANDAMTEIHVPMGWGVVFCMVHGRVTVTETTVLTANERTLLQLGALSQDSRIRLQGSGRLIAVLAPLISRKNKLSPFCDALAA